MSSDRNRLQPCLSEKFSGLIWKIKVHHSGILAVESRCSAAKLVSFSVFNIRTGEANFKEYNYEEKWNLSLAFVGKSNLVLTGHGEESPESRGIYSIDNSNGHQFWRKFNSSLNQVHDHGIQVFDPKIYPKKLSWINHRTGEEIAAPTLTGFVPEILFPKPIESFELPLFIAYDNLIGVINVLYYSEKIFVSFHENLNGTISQRLVVYQDDKILMDDIMISGIQKLQPESFFILQNNLFYIRQKKEIVSYLV